jgi:hypothetical protein
MTQCPTVAKRIQLRHDTLANWSSVGGSLVLLAGEFAYETDTGRAKVGDGVTNWNALSYFPTSTIADSVFDGGDPFSTYGIPVEAAIDCGGVF